MQNATQGHGGLFLFPASCFVVSLLCVVTDGWRSWPLLAIWALGCGARVYHDDRQVRTDCFIFGIVCSGFKKDVVVQIAKKIRKEVFVSGSSTTYLALSVTVALGLAGLPLWHAYGSSKISAETLPPNVLKWSSAYPKARIFPCQTTHARMFPKRHAFRYSYLQCGYPIIPTGVTATGTDVSDGTDQKLGSWWLRVKADDYLERGNGAMGFYNKLKLYLRKHHVEESDWSYAYLITAPRFCGYAFNPVSFWYIYDREHQLKRMILEVNNTFGERRMYLLDGSSLPSPPRTPGSQRSLISNESEPYLPDELKSRFTDIWMKDFHVSPFNSRKGSYALKALNPFPYVTYDRPTIDNTITLKSSKDHAKLVARLHSTGKALEPHTLGFFGILRFIWSWWWVGFVTFPRILREALKLYFKRKLHVWFRPEVLTSSVGRLPTASEITLHKVFKDYLFQLVHEKEDIFCITLKTAIPDIPTEIITTKYHRGQDRAVKNLEIRVLTPAFYSRLVHYTYLSEAIDRECVFTDEKNRTLWMCRPQLLPLLLAEQGSLQTEDMGSSKTKTTYLDELRWKIMKKLHCPPADPAYSVTPANSSFDIHDIRSRPYSELDNFVRAFGGQMYAGEYRRISTKLFLAQRFCFGFPEVVSLADLFFRMLLCYLGAMQLQAWSGRGRDPGTFECLEKMMTRVDWTACFGAFSEVYRDWWSVSKSAGLISACHVYGLLKGYK